MEGWTGNSVTFQRSVSGPLSCGPHTSSRSPAQRTGVQKPLNETDRDQGKETDQPKTEAKKTGKECEGGERWAGEAEGQRDGGQRGTCQLSLRGRRKQSTADMTDPMMTHNGRLITGLHAERPLAHGGPKARQETAKTPRAHSDTAVTVTGSRQLVAPSGRPTQWMSGQARG